MKKLSYLLAAALLVSGLALNANAFTSANDPGLSSPPQTGMCWVYAGGRWWYLPC